MPSIVLSLYNYQLICHRPHFIDEEEKSSALVTKLAGRGLKPGCLHHVCLVLASSLLYSQCLEYCLSYRRCLSKSL